MSFLPYMNKIKIKIECPNSEENVKYRKTSWSLSDLEIHGILMLYFR